MVILENHFNGVTPEYALSALIQRHMFPTVKDSFAEVPPSFQSDSLTEDVVDNLIAEIDPRDWFSPMRFTALKFNGSVRSMQVPHPMAHIRLSSHISKHWNEIGAKLVSNSSKIVPNTHDDGRLITMDYGDKFRNAVEESRMAIGSRFKIHADIANCFPSVYTHAIDWAIRGKSESKSSEDSSHWGAHLDQFVSRAQDGETSGIPIGPATSNLVSELILQKIDLELESLGFVFTRHVDDYECYVDDESSAEKFLNELTQKLYESRLSINHRKTKIQNIADDKLDGWIGELGLAALSPTEEPLVNIRRLRHLVSLSHANPDSSVINYALSTVSRQRDSYTNEHIEALVPELSRLIWIAPYVASRVISIVSGRVDPDSSAGAILGETLNVAIRKGHNRREVDTVLWCLYGLKQLRLAINLPILEEVVAWDPLIATLALHLFPCEALQAVRKKVLGIDRLSRYDVQEHWLLRYQCWTAGLINSSELSQKYETRYFSKLRSADVTFMK